MDFIENPVSGFGRRGSIEVITGSMFSGKTEELIRRLRRARFAGLKTEIFKPSLDKRFSETRVLVAGLDMDFMGNPFGPMPALMAIAEYVTKLHAICVRCGSLAHYSYRKSEEDQDVLLGEKDLYEPLCRHCYNTASNR